MDETRRSTADAATSALEKARIASQPYLEADAGLARRAEAMGARWQRLLADLAGGRLDAPASFAAHSALAADAQLWLDEVAAASSLLLDPEAATYHLIIAGLDRHPQAIEALAQLRGRGAGLLARGQATPTERAEIGALLAVLQQNMQAADRAWARSLAADSTLLGPVQARIRTASAAAAESSERARRSLLQEAPTDETPKAFFDALTVSIDAQFALADASMTGLSDALSARADAAERNLWAMGAGIAAALLAAGLLLRALLRQIGGAVHAAGQTAEALSHGDLSPRAAIDGGDEMAAMTRSLQRAVEGLRHMVVDMRMRVTEVATASDQISQGNGNLAQRTEEQASALQQSSAALTRIGQTADQTSADVRQAKTWRPTPTPPPSRVRCC
jgi:hypothetical protein